MNKLKFFFFTLSFLILLLACQTVSNTIDEKTALEEEELSKWLNKSETELKMAYGQPDKVQFSNSKKKFYIYTSKKFQIKCERKFEITQNNKVVGFTSKNCF
tara:strand:+ start:438 stop:743 length:306 start_codon:yes stop_codon:yes gene_type:complete